MPEPKREEKQSCDVRTGELELAGVEGNNPFGHAEEAG